MVQQLSNVVDILIAAVLIKQTRKIAAYQNLNVMLVVFLKENKSIQMWPPIYTACTIQ